MQSITAIKNKPLFRSVHCTRFLSIKRIKHVIILNIIIRNFYAMRHEIYIILSTILIANCLLE